MGLLIALAALVPAAAQAQPEDDAGVAAPPSELVEPDPEPEPHPLEARLLELEARDRAREQELVEARARLERLEAAEAEAEAAAVEAEAEPSNDPTVRPLASMFTRFEHREGYAAIGAGNPGCFSGPADSDCLRYRARVGLDIGDLRVADELVAGVRFQPQVAGFWSFGGTSGGVFHPTLALYEGALTLSIADAARLEIGRVVLNYGDERVIGALGWHPAARSFDGARVRVQPDEGGYWIDFFWTMLQEGGPGDFGHGDTYFYGVYASLGPALGPGVALDAYALGLQANDGTDPATGAQVSWSLLVHLGGRFRHRVDVIDLRVEAGLQVGRLGAAMGFDATPIVAGHVDGEVGVNLLDDRLRFGVQGFFASGDDPTTDEFEGYQQLFPTGHAFLGLTDVMGARSNAAGGSVNVMGKPLPQLRLSLDWHVFVRPEAGVFDNYAGTEGDLNVLWLPGSGFRIRAMYGVFIPNAGLFGPSPDPVHYVEVELGYELN